MDNIYIVAVNDAFVTKAWKEQLAPEGTRQSHIVRSVSYKRMTSCLTCITAVHFIADDQGAFTGALGMLFDASPLLGGPRSKVSLRALS